MERRVAKEIEHIRENVITMATKCEEAVSLAIQAFLSFDVEKAKDVIAHDGDINNLEMEIDKAIFECFALQAPVASDLRFLFSMQKMNKDLERIGDHAVNIAEAAINCHEYCHPINTPDIQTMSKMTMQMLSDAITCFVKDNAQLALKVMEHDEQVDELNRVMTRTVISMVRADTTTIETALELLRVSKNLERIADLSTNVAEDVIFHAQAKDVKHHHS